MYVDKLVFSQVMDHLPSHVFRRCVRRYGGNRYTKSFRCQDQFRCMAFAQLTYRESLRDIEACLNAQRNKLYHMGIRTRVARSTLADANDSRDWRVYADFAQSLINTARHLYANEEFALELDNTVYAIDATTIDLCLAVFPWARFRQAKAAVKLHTLLDLRGNIPAFIHITDGKVHDVNMLDLLIPEAGAFYVMDRAYVDYARLRNLDCSGSFFLTRARATFTFKRVRSRPVDKNTGLRCDQTVVLKAGNCRRRYPDQLRRIKYYDAKYDRRLVFLTNNFELPAQTITELYRQRWQIEVFFKWIKQHLRIKSFFGTSPNAVKTQIWIAISVYVLIAIIKKRTNTNASLYSILQILSLTMFEKMSLNQLLSDLDQESMTPQTSNQLNLFD